MTKARASLGFGDELDNFDPAAFASSTRPARRKAPRRAQASEAAEAVGFRSREPVLDRRRRTGRNVQFNIKVRQETIDAFCAVADAHGWGLGETLEYAVELLEKTYPARGDEK